MKKLLSLLVALVVGSIIYAQTPAGFSYQAVLRNTSGQVLGGQAAQLRITLTSSNGLTTHYQELHNVTSTAQGLINVIIGGGTILQGVLADVPWGNDQITMKTEIKVAPATAFTLLGTQPLQAVPYALYANNAKEVESSPTAGDDDPIFVVKNRLGQIVFAVYQEGVRVFVDDGTTKGTKGGFAVGGLSGNKASVEYLRITPDSARIYVNEGTKGARGGFAVGGLSGVKLQRNFVQLLPNNYFIGQDAGKSILNGQYNIFIGYEAGANTTGYHGDMDPTDGDNNIFLGYHAGYSNTVGQQNVYMGAFSGEKNETGDSNTFVGAESGKSNTGYGNTLIGAHAGASNQLNDGYKNTFIGSMCGWNNTTGNGNVFIGRESGTQNSSGADNVYIGHLAGNGNSTGSGNVFIGSKAGQNVNGWTNRLVIENSADVTTPLIYGDFNSNRVAINTASPTQTLDVNGNARFRSIGSAAGGLALYRLSDGTLTTATSDIRLKEDISTLENPLSKVLKIRGVNFKWKKDPSMGKRIGFIAQEIEQVFPELVFTNETDGYKGVNYAEMTAVLVEAMKEQQAIIDKQQKELDWLKEELENIKKLISK